MGDFSYEEIKRRAKIIGSIYLFSFILAGVINNVVAWIIWFIGIVAMNAALAWELIKRRRNRY